ncbi:MAG: D-glycero-beta-D-manno-heptose 1-phosphate adenylyltransferase [Bacteriovoracia bacterium]
MKSQLKTIEKKIFSPDRAKRECARLRRAKRKIVFTNGCFDILHPGHVLYLEKAKKRGDILVVALDTDRAVQKLKGPTRPINSLGSRMQVIAALQSVDMVTWFENANPIPLILNLKPHVLVKGGDWKPDQILGSKEVREWGGKVFSLPFVEGNSTTRIINQIIQKGADSSAV